MRKVEVPNRHIVQKLTEDELKTKKIKELQRWFSEVFAVEYAKMAMYDYFKLPRPVTEYELFYEAYKKEQEYRKLTGKTPLADIITINIF